jgi:type I restriction enzyme, S subunit
VSVAEKPKAAKFQPVALGKVVGKAKTWNPVNDSADAEFTYIDLSSIDQQSKSIYQTTQFVGWDAPSRARQIVKAGDVLVATVRPKFNGVALVAEEYNDATASTGFCVLRPDPNSIDGNFLFHWVKTPEFVSDMVRKSTGAS